MRIDRYVVEVDDVNRTIGNSQSVTHFIRGLYVCL
jgi:hypothetical protein